jgi:hypothetical protein
MHAGHELLTHKQREKERGSNLTIDQINVAISKAFCMHKKDGDDWIKWREYNLNHKWEIRYESLITTWNMMNCINRNNISGFPNQKRSSRGFTWPTTDGPFCSIISSAKEETTCWSFVPTSMTSYFEMWNKWTQKLSIYKEYRYPYNDMMSDCILTMAGMKESQKYILRPAAIRWLTISWNKSKPKQWKNQKSKFSVFEFWRNDRLPCIFMKMHTIAYPQSGQLQSYKVISLNWTFNIVTFSFF